MVPVDGKRDGNGRILCVRLRHSRKLGQETGHKQNGASKAWNAHGMNLVREEKLPDAQDLPRLGRVFHQRILCSIAPDNFAIVFVLDL